MQSSGTSTPAGDSPGPGRAFLRTTDFTPEIVPPRLRRTTYPAGQSPLVLPGLTRASSSFTITSNHQNILPLWPAAPPPGQPVVFFIRCPPARWERLAPIRRYGVVPDGPDALWAQASCRSWPAGRRERRLPVGLVSRWGRCRHQARQKGGGLTPAPVIRHLADRAPDHSVRHCRCVSLRCPVCSGIFLL